MAIIGPNDPMVKQAMASHSMDQKLMAEMNRMKSQFAIVYIANNCQTREFSVAAARELAREAVDHAQSWMPFLFERFGLITIDEAEVKP